MIKYLIGLTFSALTVPIIIVLALNNAGAEVTDFRIGGFLASDHHSGERNNENHIKSLYACANFICAGRYRNSHSVYSNFAAYSPVIGRWKSIEFSASIGVADGYTGYTTDQQFIPFASISAKFSVFKFSQVGIVSVIGWETPNLVRD